MDPIAQFICFCSTAGIFHVSEFLLTVKYNPDKVDASCEYHDRFEFLFLVIIQIYIICKF